MNLYQMGGCTTMALHPSAKGPSVLPAGHETGGDGP